MNRVSEQAAVELRLNWTSPGATHRNHHYFESINCWRDTFPGSLSRRLPQSNGEWLSEQFSAGELVAPYTSTSIHRLKTTALKLQQRHGPPIRLFRGRHYPRHLAAGTAGIFPGDLKPMRVLDLDEDTVTIDLNHPLAQTPLCLAARVVRRSGHAEEHGGRCNEPVMDALGAGIGLEALHPAAETDFFSDEPFRRLDPRADPDFYAGARLVQHIDSTAIGQISDIYSRFLEPGMKVLDLMSSWTSHLPDGIDGLQLTGLGLNIDELNANEHLAERIVHDLNARPLMPFADRHFDAVICTVSVEYLVRPLEVFRELGRILKPGAPAIITFSDRWFPTKAINLWTVLHPFERMALVFEYFRGAGNFRSLASETRRELPRPKDDKYAQRRAFSDPVFAVWGYASP